MILVLMSRSVGVHGGNRQPLWHGVLPKTCGAMAAPLKCGEVRCDVEGSNCATPTWCGCFSVCLGASVCVMVALHDTVARPLPTCIDAATAAVCYCCNCVLAGRADWKACTYSGDEEKVAAEAFREYFKPFDIMQTE